MKTLIIKLIFPVILLLSDTLYAATLIETEDDGNLQKMWVDGNKVRAEMDATGQYMLVDSKRKTAYIVIPLQRELIDISGFVAQSKNTGRGLDIKIDYVGKGPVVAGYNTKKYTLGVNGQTCEQALVSRKAMKDARLENMMESLGTIDFNPMGAQFLSDCDRATGLFAKRMKKLGMPLGTIEQDGQLRGKVKRIIRNATIPPGGFALPTGYRQITMQQKIQEITGSNLPPSIPAIMK